VIFPPQIRFKNVDEVARLRAPFPEYNLLNSLKSIVLNTILERNKHETAFNIES
jgi:hypothetical protein